MEYHKVLKRQIRKSFGANHEEEIENNGFKKFLEIVNETYDHYDWDRSMLERSMELSIKELSANNHELLKQRTELKNAYEELIDTQNKLEETEAVAALSVKLQKANEELIQEKIKVNELLKQAEEKNKELEASEEELRQSAEEMASINEQLSNTVNNLKSTQSQLVQSEKMASLGKLIAGVAHEVNTPLGAINASVESTQTAQDSYFEMLPKLIQILEKKELKIFFALIKRAQENTALISSREERKFRRGLKKELEEICGDDLATEFSTIFIDIGIYNNIEAFIPLIKHKKSEYILKTAYFLVLQKKNTSNIRLAVGKASKVVKALKSYSHFDHSDTMELTSIKHNMQTVLTLYHNTLKQGIDLQFNYDENIPSVYAFGDELSQVWTNLISNAVHAMNNKGKLDINIKNSGELISVEIKDYGKGISKRNLDHIFDPFFTTKPAGEGSGLGLDIVKTIIEKHNGNIMVDSEEGVGTTFTVILPVTKEDENLESLINVSKSVTI